VKRWKAKRGKRPVHKDSEGRRLKSKFEVKVSNALGKGWNYEARKLPYVLENNYNPDFTNGAGWPDDYWRDVIVVEAKGRFTGADRRKMLAVKKAHPDVDIRFVFMRDNPLYKGSKSRYSDWSKKHGFPFSIFPRLPI